MARLKGASTQQTAELLREIADRLMACEVAKWELTIEHELVEVSTLMHSDYVDNGKRRIVFTCEVGP